MEKIKNLLSFILVLLVAAVVVVQLFPSNHPYGGIRLPMDAPAIEQRSRELLSSMGINADGLIPQPQFRYNESLFRQVEQKYGIEKSNELTRGEVPVYHWDIRWAKPSGFTLMGGGGGEGSKAAQTVAEYLRGEVFMRLGTAGQLMELERKVADSIPLPSISQEDARRLASAFLHRYADAFAMLPDTMQPSSEKRIEQKKRVDYEFVWNTKMPVMENPVHVAVSVAGNKVTAFKTDADIPEEFNKSDVDVVWRLGLPIFYSLAIITMIVVAFRRFRAFELGFRLAIFVGVFVAVIQAITIYLSMRSELGWERLLSLILGPLFIGGALVPVWAVSESVVRELWKEKLITFDLLSKGHGLHSRVGESLVRGIALGVGSLALYLLCPFVASKLMIVSAATTGSSSIDTFGTLWSWLYVLGQGVPSVAFKISIIVMFAVSFLRGRVSSTVLLVLLGALVSAFGSVGSVAPAWLGYLNLFLFGLVTVWSFYRYDALTTFMSLYTFHVLEDAVGLLVVGNPSYTMSGWLVIGVLGALVVVGLASQARKREITDFNEIMPAFAKHITERQRLQQELEIARTVQMSFLPKVNPKVVELDIASRCAPALEVGGDYYDFIDAGNKRLGVVVGDVSGKGTQAAFFMTLTKGFVHALAEVSVSPSAVLTRVNKLFYENVERGVFISMVYGIFDTAEHVLTIARAGHNPVIMQKTKADQVQVVNPMGLALGLDAGETFARSIQEVAIPFQSGDLFVFYTDGFPEAMNKTLEEFGEERLCQTVQKLAHHSAAEIMDGIFAEMKQFVGKAAQHDDMTIVVVKVV
jgi:sigma-B regulation protein RsbU (phosphoserine phosphatase)